MNRGSTEFEAGQLRQDSRPISVTNKQYNTQGAQRINSRGSRRSNLSNKEKEFREVGDYRDRAEFERRKQLYEENARLKQEQQLAGVGGSRRTSGHRDTFKSEPRGVLGAAGRNTMQLKSQVKSEYRPRDFRGPEIMVDYASPGYS